jgi:hypothetical protein
MWYVIWGTQYLTNQDDNNKNKEKIAKDDLVETYDSILQESGLLTTVSGLIFGFLLNISLTPPKEFNEIDSLILMVALFSITFAVSLFAMPVIYHHLQYPYRNFEKFQYRSHRFIKTGILPAGITLYLGLELGLDLGLKIGFKSLNTDYIAFILATIPFIFIYSVFKKRK